MSESDASQDILHDSECETNQGTYQISESVANLDAFQGSEPDINQNK